jgi:hypothetical protein
MNRHAAIIDQLGGRAFVANVLGLKDETVKKWKVRGIPARHWHRIIALAPELSAELLDRTKPRGTQRRPRRRA